MATAMLDDFSSDAINAAVTGKSSRAPPPKGKFDPAGSYGTPAKLLDNLEVTESGGNPYAVNAQTKAVGAYQFLPETLADMHQRGIQFDPFDKKQARAAADYYISQLAQKNGGDYRKAMAAYGGFVNADPTQYVNKVMAGVDVAPQRPQQASNDPFADFNSQAITAAVKGTEKPEPAAQQNPQDLNGPITTPLYRPRSVQNREANGQPSRSATEFLRQEVVIPSVALADTIQSGIMAPVGSVAYAAARPFTSVENATAIQRAVSGNPHLFGDLTGLASTPEYQKEASQRLMAFVGEHMGEGADAISKKTGIPKADVENTMQTLMVAAGSAVKPVAGAVKTVATPVVNAAKTVGQSVREGVSLRDQLQQQFQARRNPAQPAPATQGPTLGPSGGSAGVNLDTVVANASPELQQAYAAEKASGKPLNATAVQRHVQAESLPVPVRLTKGQATDNIHQLSDEFNRRGQVQAIGDRLADQGQALKENLDAIREQAAPDAFHTNHVDAGQSLIENYLKHDADVNAGIDAKYQALRDANGGEFPVDAPALYQNVQTALKKELLSHDAPSSQLRELQQLAEKGSMTMEDFLSLRRNLGNIARTAQEGTTRHAASVMIEQMENLPLQGGAAELKPLADAARTAARQRFDALAADPAYKAAVEGRVSADDFINRFVVKGAKADVERMRQTLADQPGADQTIAWGTVDWLKRQAGVDRGNFRRDGYINSLNSLRPKLNSLVDPRTAEHLDNLGQVADYVMGQKPGTYFNNSNTFVSTLREHGATALEGIANVKLGGFPGGTMARQFLNKRKNSKWAEDALQPGAGITD
jgi:hypothetical protein